jgi:tetratricopeptide (TPR) repeat protein
VADLDNWIAALDGQTGFADEPDLSYLSDRAALRAAAEVARLYIKEGMVSIEASGTSQIERATVKLSPMAFGCYVGQDGELVGKGDTFARGTLAVVASLAYTNLPQGAIVSRRVTRQWGDTPDTTQDLPTMGADIVWSGRSDGDLQQVMKAPWPGDRGLEPGQYTVEYYVNGYLLQTGSFTVPDKETPIFGPLVFVTQYASGGTPRDPARLFPQGLEKLRALFNYSGVPEDTIVQVRWYRDGELYDWEDSTVISGWGYDAFSIDDVPAGSYRLEISLEGQDDVLQSASFEVVAVEDYLQAISSEPDDPLFHRNLGDAYVYVGEYEQAAARYRRATEIDPQCAECYYQWWSVLYEQGEYKEAVPKLERAVALWPKEYEYLSDLARTYYEMGDEERGTEIYRQAVPINPSSVYNRWGNTFYNLGRNEEAAVKYQQSIELDPNDAVVHANLSGAYWELGNYDEAINAIAAAIALDPEYAWAYNRWGNILYDQELYAQAVEKYEKAAALVPSNRLYRSNMGWAYFKLDMYEEAADAFRRATEIAPYASDYNMWGRALYELKLYQESVEKYQWAIDLSPQNGLYYYNMGWAYYVLADDTQAIAAFEQAADLAVSQGDDELLQDAQEALEMFQ